ncbi:murein biosynthesis integral membrane protein MurJ [Zhenpiania hominis]|uniref:Polysaccharide biosynthesis protein n=1 Tax=Zhenpiania hominis TaxID=2763644 RepID=A0A923NPY5_9FIRM|nr:oligosaccharide flippase family protein [Zhenpiania hominis]MBC6681092.1 polysaccharide biosynthesis protein [Zhenpiania hominis]
MSEKKSILNSVKIVILTLLIVKLIGFVKQAVIAAYFGTSGEIDKFLLVSETMEHLGAAVYSAIAITFLTIYTETLFKEGRIESNRFISNTFWLIFPIIVILTMVFIFFSDQIAYIIAPGYNSEDSEIVSKYIKLFSLTLINMFIYYVCNAVLEAEKMFFPGKFVGVIRSFCTIIAIVTLSKTLGIDAMMIGIIAYYILESIFILTCIVKKTRFHPNRPTQDKRVKYLLKISAPLLVSNGILQIQGIVDKAVASTLPVGGVSTLSYSGYLFNTTHSILIGGLCTVIFSYFTSYVTEKREELLIKTIYKYIRLSTLVLTLITILFVGYSSDIVKIVYERGAFNANATQNVSLAFCAYSIGLVFLGIRDIIIRVHYAYKNNKQAMINGIIGVIINSIGSILLSRFWGVIGIALGTTISYVFIAIISCRTIKTNIGEFRITKLWGFFVKVVMVSILVIIVVLLNNRLINLNITVVNLIIKVVITTFIYFFSLILLRIEETSKIKMLFGNKIGIKF